MLTETTQIRDTILKAFEAVFREFKNVEPPAMTDDTELMTIGLDSLDYAVLVTRLHETLGFDPFTLSSHSFYPTTRGEFVGFYERFAPR